MSYTQTTYLCCQSTKSNGSITTAVRFHLHASYNDVQIRLEKKTYELLGWYYYYYNYNQVKIVGQVKKSAA